MQKTTLRDPDVNVLLNDQFYFLSLNAETEETIIFGNHSFSFQPTGNGSGVHTLATAIGTINGQLQYPTLVIMNKNYEVVFQHGAFIPADMFLNILIAALK